MKIIKNPNWTKKQHEAFTRKVNDNDGFCPCSLIKSDDTKCICKAFIESKITGECHCGRFIKTEV